MTATDYYARLLLANKQLAACEKITLSQKEFQRIVEKAFNAGLAEGKDQTSLFDSIFGKGLR